MRQYLGTDGLSALQREDPSSHIPKQPCRRRREGGWERRRSEGEVKGGERDEKETLRDRERYGGESQRE